MVTGVEGEKGPALQLETLLALGLDQRTAENALVNSKVTANLAAVIAEVKSPAMVTPFLIRQCWFVWSLGVGIHLCSVGSLVWDLVALMLGLCRQD
jgi:hypothetical protein